MTAPTSQLPDPLRSFVGLGPAVDEAIARVDAAHMRYRALRDAGRILPNTIDAMRVEMTYHSNAIEGSTLTLRETQLVIEGHSPASGKPLREIYEARNHDRALRMVELWVDSRPPGTPVGERDLLDVHARLMADIDDQHAGRYRSYRILIRGTRFIPPGSQKFGGLIPVMLERANTPGLHPALRAAELHYNFVAIHPFADGNGRTARLMMNDLLLREGFPLTLVEIERRGEYLAALEEANAGRREAFALFVAGCVERSIGRVLGER